MILYLIGNGFDLAHNLPTSYSDFMDYIKNDIAEVNYFRQKLSFTIKNGFLNDEGYYGVINKKDDKNSDKWIALKYNREKKEFEFCKNPYSNSIYYHTLFLRFNEYGNWADLEQLYFDLIYENRESEENIKIINEEFKHLKHLLFNYLKDEVESKCVPKNESIVQHLIKTHNEDSNVQFISFNYTSNLLGDFCNLAHELNSKKSNYDNEDDFIVDLTKKIIPEIIQIHGDLKGNANDIVFGYGDDNSEQYNELKNLLNDDLLENFKTFHYLKNNRYKHILNLIETSDKIKVVSIGHSLSLCDKTLLKTIFTHKNVEKIEVAFHKNEKEPKEYFKNIYNLARIIDDNELMRKKVVPLLETLKII